MTARTEAEDSGGSVDCGETALARELPANRSSVIPPVMQTRSDLDIGSPNPHFLIDGGLEIAFVYRPVPEINAIDSGLKNRGTYTVFRPVCAAGLVERSQR